jgi:hypothetical protein
LCDQILVLNGFLKNVFVMISCLALQRSFTMDDRVAWAVISVPEAVMNGDTVDEWFSLSGRLGDGLEGSVNLVLTLTVSRSPWALYIPVP